MTALPAHLRKARCRFEAQNFAVIGVADDQWLICGGSRVSCSAAEAGSATRDPTRLQRLCDATAVLAEAAAAPAHLLQHLSADVVAVGIHGH